MCKNISNVSFEKSLAVTPPMGWNTYNTFGIEPNEKLLMEAADAMLKTGLKDAGYIYVNIDDGWMAAERDSQGNLYPDPQKFPHGLKAVTDYIHAKGLLAGIYLGCGLRTYAEKPGSLGHEQKDAALIADLGFDFLKYDYRSSPEDAPGRNLRDEFVCMSQAVKATGRPILFSICEHGRTNPWEWGIGIGQMWRTTPDIKDCFEGIFNGYGWGFNKIIELNSLLYSYSGPGHWNDPDMLIVGLNGRQEWQGPGCKPLEYRTHFALWCLSAAPLIIGCDIRNMDESTKSMLLNTELIAINQDPLGKQGYPLVKYQPIRYWVKPLSGGAWAVGIHNLSGKPETIKNLRQEIGLESYGKALIRDLWTHRTIGPFTDDFTCQVENLDTLVFRIEPVA